MYCCRIVQKTKSARRALVATLSIACVYTTSLERGGNGAPVRRRQTDDRSRRTAARPIPRPHYDSSSPYRRVVFTRTSRVLPALRIPFHTAPPSPSPLPPSTTTHFCFRHAKLGDHSTTLKSSFVNGLPIRSQYAILDRKTNVTAAARFFDISPPVLDNSTRSRRNSQTDYRRTFAAEFQETSPTL